MQPQIAHIYRNGRFCGYGVTVDGELIDRQLSAGIHCSPDDISKVTVTLSVDNEVIENPVRIDLQVK
ncbi:hypothetical protein GCM10009413_00390 [Tatumella punctata]